MSLARRSASIRAKMSVACPGGDGTSMFTGLSREADCAAPAAGMRPPAAMGARGLKRMGITHLWSEVTGGIVATGCAAPPAASHHGFAVFPGASQVAPQRHDQQGQDSGRDHGPDQYV